MKKNEEKNLNQNMKAEKYYENINLELDKSILQNVIIKENNIKDGNKEIIEYDVFMQFKGEYIKIATINENGKLIPNENILKEEKYTEEELNVLGDMINRLGLEKDEIDLEKLKEQIKQLESKTKEEFEKNSKEQANTEEKEEEEKDTQEKVEKDDEEETKNEDTEKQEIAKKYNVNTKDVIYLNTTGEKITEDKDFSHLIKWAEGRDDVYVIANKYGEIDKVIEKKDGKYNEIEAELPKTNGNNPNITIQRVGKDKITEERPLKIHQLDSKTALATVRNEWGELELLYCRKQEGEEKYWGSVVPEKSNKNLRQLNYEERAFIDYKNTSGMDLANKEEELMKSQDLHDRGIPSKEEGVQVYEINGNSSQNRDVVKEDIVEDLMKKDGIIDKLTVPPGYYENKAERVLKLLEKNKEMKYEQAVEQIENEGSRESGGRTPGENRKRE